MNEQRKKAYHQLIKQLLTCESGEENQVLSDNRELVEPELLQVMAEEAEKLADNGQLNQANFFINLLLQLGEDLGSSQQPQTIRKETADTLFNLGIRWYQTSQFTLALQVWQYTFTIFQEIKNRNGEANSLSNLGIAYDSLGQYERAIEYYQQSLSIFQELKNRQGEANSLGNLGSAYRTLGQYERAIEYHQQSLTLKRELKNRQGEANSLYNLGSAYRELGQTEAAIEAFQASLKIATPKTMPNVCIFAGRNLGNIAFTQGNWELAITGYEPAIEAIELLRNSSLTDDRRQQVLEENLNVYANIVQCYINLEQYDKALEYADRSRSRFLADLFHNKDLYSKGDIPPQVQEYLDLQQQIDRLRFNSPSDDMMGDRSSTPASTEAKLEKIKQLAAEKQQIWESIRRENNELAAQLQPTPLSFPQMQQLIPDRKTALLNFYTTANDTFIFILRHPDANSPLDPSIISPARGDTIAPSPRRRGLGRGVGGEVDRVSQRWRGVGGEVDRVSCSGLQTVKPRLANKPIFGPHYSANQLAFGSHYSANRLTLLQTGLQTGISAQIK